VAKVVRKVKMLHWDKLQPHQMRGTVWENANDGGQPRTLNPEP
jgi:hypothetical protein